MVVWCAPSIDAAIIVTPAHTSVNWLYTENMT